MTTLIVLFCCGGAMALLIVGALIGSTITRQAHYNDGWNDANHAAFEQRQADTSAPAIKIQPRITK